MVGVAVLVCDRSGAALQGGTVGVYVLQVIGGRESTSRDLLIKHAFDVIDECFLPINELMKRKDGVWHRVRELLFPGYVFVQTQQSEALAERMRTIPVFMRMLGSNDKFIPLAPDELAWLELFSPSKTHVVEMSQGVIEGDKVVVTEGPLKGREAMIAKINRHKRLAYLDLSMLGRTKRVRIGLEIVLKR